MNRISFIAIIFFLILLPVSLFSLDSMDCGTQVKNHHENYFVIVTDRSGSMKADGALDYSKIGIVEFLKNMKSTDQVSLITFANDIKTEQDFTKDKQSILNRLKAIRSGGGTRLYDAIAKGMVSLSGKEGRKVVIFLTDGKDTTSRFSIRDLEQMNVAEDIFLYGMGLGDVDARALKRITEISHGSFIVSPSAEKLQNLYGELQNSHYVLGRKLDATGIFSIRSVPSGMAVFLDGNIAGKTPLKIVAVKPGMHDLEVEFPKGRWQCTSNLEPGYTAFVQALESELPNDVVIETIPGRCAVFVDDSYAGLSHMLNSSQGIKDGQLRIKGLSPGKHTIRIVPAPESDLMDGVEFDLSVTNSPLLIRTEVFMKQYKVLRFDNGKELETIKFSGF